MAELNNKKRVRDDSDESELDSPEVKRLRDDLLGNLDDSDLCTNPGLDSFMKSFEEEIFASPSLVPFVDLTSDSGDSRPDFGFLLEASDYDLGIPPSTTTSSSDRSVELVGVWSNSGAELSELWGFEDQIPSYDAFDFGISGGGVNYYVDDDEEYSALDGLFDYSDIGFGLSDGV